MIQKLFTIYDNKARCYQSIFMAPTLPAGMRMFADAISDPNSSLARHPADFTLVEVGTFDERLGNVNKKEGGPHPVAPATDFIMDTTHAFPDPAEKIVMEGLTVNGEDIDAPE